MHKLLTLLAFIATLLLVGCSLPDMPGVYRPTIQQGNVVTQKMINQLEPNMSKNQVKFILGTPLLVDAFHQDRWDYLYSMDDHSDTLTKERIALYFEDDRLIAIKGDYRPMSLADPLAGQEDIVHTVPDYKDRGKGLLGKAMETVGLGSDELPERIPMEQGEVTEAGRGGVRVRCCNSVRPAKMIAWWERLMGTNRHHENGNQLRVGSQDNGDRWGLARSCAAVASLAPLPEPGFHLRYNPRRAQRWYRLV